MNIIDQLPNYIFWKDCHGRFLGGNEIFIKAAGLQSLNELIGKKDEDLPWANYSELYKKSDQAVLEGNSVLNVTEPNCANNELVIATVHKKPLLNENKHIIGIIGSYTINPIDKPAIQLSHKQKQILIYVTQGLSAKQISRELNLTVRTVEFYIQILKDKFSCKNKFELIVKVLKTPEVLV